MKKKLVCIVYISILLLATFFSVAVTSKTNTPLAQTIGIVDNWPTLGHDAAHSGFSTSLMPTTSTLLFSKPIVTDLINTPAGASIVDGRLYLVTSAGYLYSFNASTGQIIYNQSNFGLVNSVPAFNNDRLFFGSYNDNIYCCNALTGAIVWARNTSNVVSTSPTVVNNKIYLGGYNNKMMCLDSDGNWLWNYTTGNMITSSPAVVDGRVYFGSYDTKLYCVDANENGDGTTNLLWSVTIGTTVDKAPTVANGKVYVPSSNKIYCFDAISGNAISGWPFSGSGTIFPLAVANNKVYGGGNSFYCLNATNGNLIWTYTSGTIKSTAAIADGKVYYTNYGRQIVCLDALGNGDGTTTKYWDYFLYIKSYTAPVLYNGNIYIPSVSYLHIFGINTPPSTPEILGPTEGVIMKPCTFTISADDAQYQDLTYTIQWGDGNTGTYGPYAAGISFQASHTWNVNGTYQIQVKASDGQMVSAPATHTITIKQPELAIGTIKGGLLKITAEIKNIGEAIAENISWNMTLNGTGYVWKGAVASGVFDTLDANGIQIVTDKPVFGLGKVNITVTARADNIHEVTKSAEVFLFFIFVFVK